MDSASRKALRKTGLAIFRSYAHDNSLELALSTATAFWPELRTALIQLAAWVGTHWSEPDVKVPVYRKLLENMGDLVRQHTPGTVYGTGDILVHSYAHLETCFRHVSSCEVRCHDDVWNWRTTPFVVFWDRNAPTKTRRRKLVVTRLFDPDVEDLWDTLSHDPCPAPHDQVIPPELWRLFCEAAAARRLVDPAA